MGVFLPQNPGPELAAELTVVGSVLWDNELLNAITLVPSDFGHTLLAQTWEEILKLRDDGKPVDTITLSQIHPDRAALYHEVWDYGVPPTAEFYAEEVRSNAIRRNLGMAAETLQHIVKDQAEDVEVLSEQARKLIDEAIGTRQSKVDDSGILVPLVVNAIGTAKIGCPTPWQSLTRAIRAFRPGGLYVIAARPAVGKSALALQIASELEKYGSVGFFTLEMGSHEVVQRLIAQQAMVPLAQVDGSEKLTDEHRARIEAWQAGYSGRILFDDRGTLTMADVRAQVRTWMREQPLAGIVIDYLQLMTPTTKTHDNRAVIVGEMSRAAKMIAKDFNIPVILLSQLNRNAEGRVDKRPAMADLRESGAIEQDADVVILLYNQTQSSGEPTMPGQDDDLELIIAKSRQGPAMTVHLRWRGRYVTANDLN